MAGRFVTEAGFNKRSSTELGRAQMQYNPPPPQPESACGALTARRIRKHDQRFIKSSSKRVKQQAVKCIFFSLFFSSPGNFRPLSPHPPIPWVFDAAFHFRGRRRESSGHRKKRGVVSSAPFGPNGQVLAEKRELTAVVGHFQEP